jgi:peptidoglycan/LPS O-acetylase OafA/YrhL
MAENATTKLDQLTSLRFFAAFMIVLHHAQGLFGIDMHGINLGQGVSFFFVLSGFILSYVYPELKGWEGVKRFWRARIARLWPGFFVSFLLGFFLLKQSWDAKTGLPYLLLLQSWLPLSSFYFSYNAAAWSISTELFFYLAFPLLIWRWPQSWHWKLALSAALLAAVVAAARLLNLPDYGNPYDGQQGMLVTQHGLIYISPLARIFEFVFGMCVAWMWRAKRVTWSYTTASVLEVAVIVACMVSVCVMGSFAEAVRRSVIGPTGALWVMHGGSMFAFAALIYVMAFGRGIVSKILSQHVLVVLGEISFSLYLIHQTLLSYYRNYPQDFLSLPAAPAFVAFLIILLAFSYLLWLLVEIPGRNVLLGRKPIHGSVQMQKDWQTGTGTTRNTVLVAMALTGALLVCMWPLLRQVGFAGLQATLFSLLFIVPMMSLKQNKIWQRLRTPNVLVAVVAVLVFVYAAYIAIRYASQIPMDFYAFRQTQTALTSLWFVKDGFHLAYQTPVAGAPWSIPFEFPLYQYIVALASQLTPLSLDACGRLVSFVFLVLCLVPARAIVRRLELAPATWLVFAALLLSSPVYLYWGRTFMIETMAVFFALAGIRYFIDLLQNRATAFTAFMFLLCMSLSILQKATTGMAVLAILGVCYFFSSLADLKNNKAAAVAFVGRRIGMAALYVGVPLSIGILWTVYTDQVKVLNPLGQHLTSSALSSWNWGTLSQKLSSTLYVEVLWGRIFQQNLGGVIGLAVLVFAACSPTKTKIKLVVLAAVAMGVVPIFLFTNLHIVHTYYQAANVIFLIFALSVGLGHIIAQSFGRTDLLVVLLLALVGSNYYWFDKEYSGVVKVDFHRGNSRDVAVAELLLCLSGRAQILHCAGLCEGL